MKVRSFSGALVVALLASTGVTPVAYAQDRAPPQLATRDAKPLVKPTAVLDEAWARALWTVFDGMHRREAAEQVAATRTLAAEPPATPPPEPVPATIVLAPRRIAWLPAGSLRDALAQSPWELTPVPITPPVESRLFVSGDQAVLLGARLQLPWMVP